RSRLKQPHKFGVRGHRVPFFSISVEHTAELGELVFCAQCSRLRAQCSRMPENLTLSDHRLLLR
ncbi:MAG: hypothetical protein ACK5WG_08515, partial [Betaproteobacteria bacterium]